LKIVLALGNFLNGRSARGDAAAFKLKSLTTLTDTKTSDNKSTLLHFLINHLTQHSPSTLSVTAELAGVGAASGEARKICVSCFVEQKNKEQNGTSFKMIFRL
jgi:hypothetical protein